MRTSRQQGPCWIWAGKVRKGYGQYGDRQAHRVIYEKVIGMEVPPEMHLHHRCENPLCVNPWHMQILTRAEHERLHGRHGDKCPAGHEYTPENTYEFTRKDGRRERHCRKCRRDRHWERHGKGIRRNRTKYSQPSVQKD